MKTILLVEHCTAKEFLLKKAKEKGYRIIMVASEPKDFFKKYIADTDVIITDVFDAKNMVEKTFFFIQKNGLKIDAIGTFSDDLVVATADLAALLGCNGIGQLAARCTSSNKLAMRTKVATSGKVMQPKFAPFNIYDREDSIVLERFPKPCVIKPQFGTTSHGVFMIRDNNFDYDDLADRISKTVNREIRESFRYFSGNMLVEEYIPGKMISVDGFVSRGDVSIVGSIEFIMGEEPYFTQVASYIPAQLSEVESSAVKDALKNVVDVLGFGYAPFHAEFRIKDGIPYLIEIAGRMAGALIHETYDRVYGIDMIDLMYSNWLGESIPKDFSPFGINYHALYYPDIQSPGVLLGVYGYEKFSQIKGINYFKLMAKIGDTLKTYPNTPSPIFEFSYFTKNMEEIEEIKSRLDELITYNVGTL
jgi:biotin carboxylase